MVCGQHLSITLVLALLCCPVLLPAMLRSFDQLTPASGHLLKGFTFTKVLSITEFIIWVLDSRVICVLDCRSKGCVANRNRNRNLQTSKAPLESQAQGTSLFTSAASS